VLGESRRARVWRLSAQTANTAEHLEVYCEILGIKVGRSWPVDPRLEPDEIGFVDLPGVNWRDGRAVRTLAAQLERLGRPRVHLVVNGAYENSLLLRQAQALAPLGVEDLLVTHLDEEARWGRIWNLVLGTNCGIRFLSAGQNVPGDFLAGSPEALLGRQFPV